jgi:hypothetical protein
MRIRPRAHPKIFDGYEGLCIRFARGKDNCGSAENGGQQDCPNRRVCMRPAEGNRSSGALKRACDTAIIPPVTPPRMTLQRAALICMVKELVFE